MSVSYFDRKMIPSLIRFIMELSTWIWLIFFNIIILIISVLSLAVFNVPGDKKAIELGTTGLSVAGPVRVAIEFTTAGVGIAAAFAVGNLITGVLQISIVILYLLTDRKRLIWLIGRGSKPKYIDYLHSLTKQKKSESNH